MTTPSVLVPDLDKLETALNDVPLDLNLSDEVEKYNTILLAARAYLASQRMIATAKEDTPAKTPADITPQTDDKLLITEDNDRQKDRQFSAKGRPSAYSCPTCREHNVRCFEGYKECPDCGMRLNFAAKEETPQAHIKATLLEVKTAVAAGNLSKTSGETIRTALSQSKDTKALLAWTYENGPATHKLDDCKIPEVLAIREAIK